MKLLLLRALKSYQFIWIVKRFWIHVERTAWRFWYTSVKCTEIMRMYIFACAKMWIPCFVVLSAKTLLPLVYTMSPLWKFSIPSIDKGVNYRTIHYTSFVYVQCFKSINLFGRMYIICIILFYKCDDILYATCIMLFDMNPFWFDI